jgi:hypothetical protein
MATWNPNTPASLSEELSTSQPKINGNFTIIGSTYGTDHVPLGAVTNTGYHNQSTYATQSSVPAADPNNLRLFTQLVGTVPQLFAQYPSSAGSELVQLSSQSVQCPAYIQGTWSIQEVSCTINGIIWRWGTMTTSAGIGPNSAATVTFGGAASPTPFPNNIFSVGLSFLGTNVGGFFITTYGLSSFLLAAGASIGTGTHGVVSYLAVGN